MFTNKEVTLLLWEHYRNVMRFSNPQETNKPMLVFLGNLSVEEVADKVRSSDTIREAAHEIRQSLLDYDFNLDDRFGDAQHLQLSWNAIFLPEPILSFLLLYLVQTH